MTFCVKLKSKSNKSEKKYLFIIMTKKFPFPGYSSRELSNINCISFWDNGEMAYTALKRINELKSSNDRKKANIMLSEWLV